jgi:di/tricarboxylate transporter
MSEISITFAVAAAVVALFVWNRIPVVVVALATSLALYLLGVLNLEEAVGGLGDPAVIFIASLFVVSAGLDATGVTAWAGQFLIEKAGKSHTRLLLMIMTLVAILSAVISVNGAVAALLPMLVVMAIRLQRPASKLLMPLVFAAHAGSMLALTGTPVNVLASEAAMKAGVKPFGYLEFSLVGVPLVLGTMAIIILFGQRLLPERSSRMIPADLSTHARTLIEHYALNEDVFRLRVRSDSPYIGLPADAIDLGEYPGVTLVSIQARVAGGPVLGAAVGEGDILIVRGKARTVGDLAGDKSLAFRSKQTAADVAEALFNRKSGLGELVIPPRSDLIGMPVFPGMVTPSGDLVILAVQRKGEDQTGETVLAPGDTLLLQGTWKALDERLDKPGILLVDSPELVRRQAVPMGSGAFRAIAVLAGMIVLIATEAVPAVVAGLTAACLAIVLRVITVSQAYRAVNWTTVILVGAMMALSTAISKTGAADLLAEKLVQLVGGSGPYALTAGLFVLTALFGQMISNTATALIIFPIAVSAAAEVGMSPHAVIMSVAVAAAASFLTPVATPVNLMVMGPGGYRFGDYWKLGLPLMLWFSIVAVFLVPVFWPF